MKKNVDVSKEINSAYIGLKSNEMEFIDEIATQLTELNFHEDTFEVIGEKGINLILWS